MSDILEHIRARRSIRRYTDEPVDIDAVQRLLEAAMAAPSAMNRRPWEFLVVTDPDRLQKLRRWLPLGRYQAPVAILVCGNMHRMPPGPPQGFWVQDCSAAIQNILLAATGMGLGSVWVGIHPIQPLVWGVRRAMGLPRHIKPLGLVWVGHAAERKSPRSQFDPERVHWNVYKHHTPPSDERTP